MGFWGTEGIMISTPWVFDFQIVGLSFPFVPIDMVFPTNRADNHQQIS